MALHAARTVRPGGLRGPGLCTLSGRGCGCVGFPLPHRRGLRPAVYCRPGGASSPSFGANACLGTRRCGVRRWGFDGSVLWRSVFWLYRPADWPTDQPTGRPTSRSVARPSGSRSAAGGLEGAGCGPGLDSWERPGLGGLIAAVVMRGGRQAMWRPGLSSLTRVGVGWIPGRRLPKLRSSALHGEIRFSGVRARVRASGASMSSGIWHRHAFWVSGTPGQLWSPTPGPFQNFGPEEESGRSRYPP